MHKILLYIPTRGRRSVRDLRLILLILNRKFLNTFNTYFFRKFINDSTGFPILTIPFVLHIVVEQTKVGVVVALENGFKANFRSYIKVQAFSFGFFSFSFHVQIRQLLVCTAHTSNHHFFYRLYAALTEHY